MRLAGCGSNHRRVARRKTGVGEGVVDQADGESPGRLGHIDRRIIVRDEVSFAAGRYFATPQRFVETESEFERSALGFNAISPVVSLGRKDGDRNVVCAQRGELVRHDAHQMGFDR